MRDGPSAFPSPSSLTALHYTAAEGVREPNRRCRRWTGLATNRKIRNLHVALKSEVQ